MLSKELIKKIRLIQIRTRHLVTETLAGEYKSAFKGRGIEFDEVREYLPGDDIRTIDWNVTARTGKPHVKRYVEERELTVILMVDASSSGLFGSTERAKNDLAAEVAAFLAYSAIRNNDRVGLIIFTDQIELFIPPKKGRSHVLRVIREILYFGTPEHSATNITGAMDFLQKVCTRKSVVFLLSDFLCDEYENALIRTAKRHDLIPITLLDPREETLPNIGFLILMDAETGENILVDTHDPRVRATYARLAADDAAARTRTFRRMGLDSMILRTDTPYVDTLVHFFKRREKRGGLE